MHGLRKILGSACDSDELILHGLYAFYDFFSFEGICEIGYNKHKTFLFQIGIQLQIIFLFIFCFLQQLTLHIFQQLRSLNNPQKYLRHINQISVVEYFHAIWEFNGQEDRMFNLVPDIGSGDVIVKSLGIIFYDYFALTFTFVLAFDELLIQTVVVEWLHKGTELFLLVVSSWSSGVNKYRRTDDRC